MKKNTIYFQNIRGNQLEGEKRDEVKFEEKDLKLKYLFSQGIQTWEKKYSVVLEVKNMI